MIDVFVRGMPYVKHKVRGRVEGAKEWSVAVKAQTDHLGSMAGPCRLDVEFVLPAGSFPTDHPCGPDLDNLLKRLLDGLNDTVLREAPGRDGAVVKLNARKRKAAAGEPTGARILLSQARF